MRKRDYSPSEGLATADTLQGPSTTQSYDLMCSVPNSNLLKTVIPGWLWRGITPDGGKQKIPICDNRKKKNRELKLEHHSSVLKLTIKAPQSHTHREFVTFMEMQVSYCRGSPSSRRTKVWHFWTQTNILWFDVIFKKETAINNQLQSKWETRLI